MEMYSHVEVFCKVGRLIECTRQLFILRTFRRLTTYIQVHTWNVRLSETRTDVAQSELDTRCG